MNPTVNINGVAEAKAVADEVRKSVEPKTIAITDAHGDRREVLLVPHGVDVKSTKALTDEYRTAPERRKGTATLQELDSFIAHVKRFADADSLIFADRSPTAPKLTAVLDYHRKGAEGAPRFGTHRSHYAFPISEEWKRWNGKNGEAMGQAEFAAWIEDHLLDVADATQPSQGAVKFATALGGLRFAGAARLLTLSRGLSVLVKHDIGNHVNLANGEAQIQFKESHSDAAGQQLDVPGAFLLAIPVFQGGPPYEISARLRYRVNSGKFVWFYELHRAQAAFDHAVDEACERAAKETGLEVLAGTPE